MNISQAFHPFDIRGDYPRVVDEKLAFLVGYSVAKILDAKNLVVASDNRPSSPRLRTAVAAGISQAGAAATDLGELPVAVFYHTVRQGQSGGGIMITASHIYDRQNGFKIVKDKALPFNEGEILKIKEVVSHHHELTAKVPASHQEKDISAREMASQSYVTEVTSRFKTLAYPSKVIFDSGQTILTPLLKKILPLLALDHELLTTPRDLNPLLADTRRHLAQQITATRAGLGVIFDGDGDRVLFLNRHGELIPPTFILGLIARGFPKVVLDMRAGVAAYTTAKTLVPSWAQNIKFAMREDQKIAFGGETSGHLIFREWYSIDDGIFAALKFLQLMAHVDLEAEIRKLEKTFVELAEENFPKSDNYPLVLGKIADEFRQKGESVSILDGVTVCGEDYKFNLRPSLTEPLLRLNLEAHSQKRAQEIHQEVTRLLRSGGS